MQVLLTENAGSINVWKNVKFLEKVIVLIYYWMSCKFTRLVRACWCTCGERKWALGTLQSTTPLQKHTVPKLAKFFDFFRISHQAKIITSHFQPSTIKIFSIRLACRAVRANQALRTRTAMINAQLTNQITFDHLVKTTIWFWKRKKK